jgi:hypothetical protein
MVGGNFLVYKSTNRNLWKFRSIPLKDHKVRYIPLQVNDMWGSHESMTCGFNGIYLIFGSFNGMNPNYKYFLLAPFRE